MSPPPKKLLDQLRDQVNLKHYSTRTADSYVYWARQFIRIHNLRHPKDMGVPEINQFLTHLAVDKKGAADNDPPADPTNGIDCSSDPRRSA
jgi:hypothetical protein